MPAFFGSAVYETTTTTGTGTLDLSGAVADWGAFSDGDLTSPAPVAYWILDGSQKPLECGFGTWTSGSPPTLSRDDVVGPGGITTPVSLSAGTKYVTCAPVHPQLNGQNWVDVASAGTTNVGNQKSPFVRITGTTTITSLGTPAAGYPLVYVRFAASLTLTHNGTSLILPGGASITTAAGDVAMFKHEGSGNWRCVSYTRADGSALVGAGLDAVAEDILPDTDSTRDLGSASKAWAEAWADAFGDPASGDTIAAPYIVRGPAKSWSNLNGNGTIALRDSLNVSSVTDNSAGNYTNNFTTAFDAADFGAVVSGSNDTSSYDRAALGSFAVGSISYLRMTSSNSPTDGTTICVACHGDLA